MVYLPLIRLFASVPDGTTKSSNEVVRAATDSDSWINRTNHHRPDLSLKLGPDQSVFCCYWLENTSPRSALNTDRWCEIADMCYRCTVWGDLRLPSPCNLRGRRFGPRAVLGLCYYNTILLDTKSKFRS